MYSSKGILINLLSSGETFFGMQKIPPTPNYSRCLLTTVNAVNPKNILDIIDIEKFVSIIYL